VASHSGILIRLLTWNLCHGRDAPPDAALHTWRSRLTRRPESNTTHIQVNVSLRHEFAAKLASWKWDVALLQEAPPRWLHDLERATGAAGVRVPTSRNWLAPLRAAIAERNPDLIASNEGGSNAILVRGPARIAESDSATLAVWPERRKLLLTRLELPDGRRLAVACTHLSVPSTGRRPGEALRAAALAVEWAAGDPLVLGGDLNLRPAHEPAAFATLSERFGLAPPTGPKMLDHLLGRGVEVVEPPAALAAAEREVAGPADLAIRLSDHAPVAAAFRVR
jgi:endonuclease/exonuclease/phosphatase family metal-dependent hydrolase